MATRPPRPFTKPLAEKRYRRSLRNRIYLETDRAFLDAITTTDASGRIVLARELETEERERLEKLRKEARKNRGAVRTGKLIVLLVLVAMVIVFNVVFKDRLVERGAESLLQSVFSAQADLTGVSFRPFAGVISFSSLTVADAERPFQNLFALGNGRLSIDGWQLLHRRVIIRDLTVSGLAFGTPRERSGAIESDPLPPDGERDSSAAPEDDAPGFSFETLGLPDTLDARAFVAEQYELLETPVRVETIAAEASTYVSRWESEIATLAADGTESADRIRALASTDFRAIRSVEQALALLEETNDLAETTVAYADTVRASVTEATAEGRAIVSAAASVPEYVRDDYARVRAQIPDIRTEGRDFLVGLVEPYLRERLGAWYDRILKGYAYFERLRAQAEPRVAGPGRRRGTIVNFETNDYPAFSLEQGFASASGARDLELVVESLSSDPDVTGEPARIAYRDTAGDESLSLGAIVDRRTAAEVPLSLTARAGAKPVALSRGLPALGLEQFTAVTDVELALVRAADDSVSGTVALNAERIAIAGSPDSGSIGELVRQVLTGPDPLVARFSWGVSADGAVSLSDGTTNLDERIAGLVRERIDATLADFQRRVEAELDAVLGPQLASVESALSGIVDVQATADELLALATDREAAAAALQARAADAVDSLRTAVEAEARARLDAARAEAEAAARKQADRAQAEAEEAVRDQVEGVRNRLNLPGF